MTIQATEIGNFDTLPEGWGQSYCSSGGIIYYPIGPDGLPVWSESTFTKPIEGVK